MIKHRASRLTVAVLAAVAVVVVAGSVATASNMGMKLNKALFRPVSGGGSESGNNWVSLPYRNPYLGGTCTTAAGVPCVGALCTQLALPTLATTVFQIDPATGASSNVSCPTTHPSTADSTALVAGRAVRIRGTTLPASVIIVGSHDGGLVVTLPATGAGFPDKGNLWFAVPYHTTAVTAADLCTQAGLANLSGTVRTVNASAGSGTLVSCGTATASTLVLRLGEGARLRDSSIVAPAVKAFTPAHF